MGFEERCREFIDYLQPKLDEFEDILLKNKIFIDRTANIGVLPLNVAINYGCSGPMLRGSGLRRYLVSGRLERRSSSAFRLRLWWRPPGCPAGPPLLADEMEVCDMSAGMKSRSTAELTVICAQRAQWTVPGG